MIWDPRKVEREKVERRKGEWRKEQSDDAGSIIPSKAPFPFPPFDLSPFRPFYLPARSSASRIRIARLSGLNGFWRNGYGELRMEGCSLSPSV